MTLHGQRALRLVLVVWAAALAIVRRVRTETVGEAHAFVTGRDRAFHATEASTIGRALRRWSPRFRWQRTWQHVPRAFLAGTVAMAMTALLGRLLGLPGLLLLAPALGAAVVALIVVVVARRDVRPFEIARRADVNLGLDERLATALELLDDGQTGELADRQIGEAVGLAERIDPRHAFPLFAAGSGASRDARRYGGWSALVLAAALALVFWPGGRGALPQTQRELLALADPTRREEEAVPRITANGPIGELDAVQGRTGRPDELGEQSGLLGPPQTSGPGQAGEQQQPPSAGQARQDASDQRSPTAAERQAALQQLGNALRQSQTGRSAGEALRAGDTQRASQQLQQLAEGVRDLSPGERQSLAQAFQQAGQQIGDSDRALASSAQRAGDALSQHRNQDAQAAIRDAASQVSQSGRQIEAQRALESRAQQLERGGAPQLPQQAQPGATGQAQDTRSGQPGSAMQQAGRPEDGTGGQGTSLADLESSLRDGGLQSGAGSGGSGAGAGFGAGQDRPGPPTRLAVEARTVTVEADIREGPSVWRPPNPYAPPAPAAPPSAAVPGLPASAAPVGAGPDSNAVPVDLADPVRQYFTPEQSR